MTATTGVGGLIYGRALVDQRTGKKINFEELGNGGVPGDIAEILASKAPLDSPIFTGNPQAPTPLDDAVGKEIANVEFVRKILSAESGQIKETAEEAAKTAMSAQDAVNDLSKIVDDQFATSTAYSITEINRQFNALKITTGKHAGLWRYLTASGGINWYFLFLAMYESDRKAFTLQDRITICEKALRYGLTVPYMTSTAYPTGQHVMIDNKLFFVNIAGTSGDRTPDVSNTNTGEFVRTGTLVLECVGNTTKEIPTSWSWFFLDIATDLYKPVAPDSTDSYPSLWFACIGEFADAAWLQTPSEIGDYTRWDVIKQVAQKNILDQLNSNAHLVMTFQGGIAPGSTDYNICFCQDNSEVYAGLRSLASMAAMAGDTSAETQYKSLMVTIKQGLLELFVPEQKRFKTYYNESDYPSTPDVSRFVQKDRFSVAPWRFDVLTSLEKDTYGYPVLNTIMESYPDLFTDDFAGKDSFFAMSDFFAFVAKATASQTAVLATLRRVQIRGTSGSTISDIVSAISVAPWGVSSQNNLSDFLRINGKSVIGNGDISVPSRKVRHIKPANNAQVIVDDIDGDTVLFIDNDDSLTYLQFKMYPATVDGARLSIVSKEDVIRTAYLTSLVGMIETPPSLFGGKVVTFTYNATLNTWCLNFTPTASSDAKNILTESAGVLTVDATHPVIPKIVVGLLNTSLGNVADMSGGAKKYTLKMEVSNPVGKGVVGGVGIAVSATLEPRYLYLTQDKKYIPAQYFITSTSSTSSTITINISVIMPETPFYAVDITTLEEVSQAGAGALPCVVAASIIAGTTLRQNGMM